MNWIDRLRALLCQIYTAWGGDCSELGMDAPAWITTVEGEFNESGVPSFDGDGGLESFLATLAETEAHLLLHGNTLSATDEARLTGLIANLRAGLDAGDLE